MSTTSTGSAGAATVAPASAASGLRVPRRVAIVHYWLINARGGERVLEALCALFPDAPVYTHALDRSTLSPALAAREIRTTFIDRLPGARRHCQRYLPLMPIALEQLDLTDYDLVISSESGPAKGIVPGPHARHLCYVHTPMRYVWDQYGLYRESSGRVTRLLMPWLASRLRVWDVTSAARVDAFVANSHHVAARVERYWRREASVVHPPVDVDAFAPASPDELGDFYLWAGELVAYKRPETAVDAFLEGRDAAGRERRLVVIGRGERLDPLRRRAAGAANVEFLGRVDFDALRDRMAHCRALVFPGEEDFGMVPVEVMASGRPVVALGRGGALDTVIDGRTGALYDEPTVAGLLGALDRFEAEIEPGIDPEALVAHARRFDRRAFDAGIREALAGLGMRAP